MSYDGKCGSCNNFYDDHDNLFDPRYTYPAKGYCREFKTYYVPENSCGRYEPRSYVTTMVCKKLGFNKENEVYKTIVGFQKNVMEKDDSYSKLLEEYDIVGPMIAKELASEDESVVGKIYNIFLVPVAKSINNNKADQAVFKYKNMLEILKAHYKIDEETINNRKTAAKKRFKVLSVKKNI